MWNLEFLGLLPPCLAKVPLQGDPPATEHCREGSFPAPVRQPGAPCGCEHPGNRDIRGALGPL